MEKKTKKKVKIIVCIVAVVVVSIISVFIGKEIELKVVESKVSTLMGEIKSGHIENSDLDVPELIYQNIVEDMDPKLEKIITAGTGGADTIRDGWDSILGSMDYSVKEVKKQDGVYHITMSVSNRDLIYCLIRTVEKMTQSKIKLIAGVLTGTATEDFWNTYSKVGESMSNNVSQEYEILIEREGFHCWKISYNPKMLGTIAGLDEQYLVLFPEEIQTIEYDSKDK